MGGRGGSGSGRAGDGEPLESGRDLRSLGPEELLELFLDLERYVRSGTAPLSAYGALASALQEIERRRLTGGQDGKPTLLGG